MTATELNLTATARIIGVTNAELRQWVNEGMPYVNNGDMVRSRFVVADIFRWLRSGKTAVTPESEMTAVEAKRRREVATALRAELELAKEREQLVVIDDIMAEFSDALTNVRAILISMPSRLSGVLSHQDEDEIARLLEADISGALETLAQYKHECRVDYELLDTGS